MGNCYTAAVYMNLLSLVSNQAAELSAGKQVLMFSYGSGYVATAFVLHARTPSAHNCLAHGDERFTLQRIARVTDIAARLASRTRRSISEFTAAMDLRAERYGKADYTPSGSIADLFPNTFYLVAIDKEYRRSYARSPKR